ncbi:hypothetical protein [Algisphaera agarilytica]|uniref:ABC-type transporter Mla subunit MlaD n=1 Tax=Algisphaera agarilytica TaxID=1385975 RepID=A0A7X0H355_9BACT|nr:hypothetical protein [Algisphaera agarilytica]MBB6428218.1 ABC-type transporter Mla subunit MlaD [Algisphaera agarilytica]
MINPAKPFASASSRASSPTAATKADLSGLLDRARDERFRLLKMLKEARAEVEVTLKKTQPPKPQAEAEPTTMTVAETPAVEAEGNTAETTQKLQALITKLGALDAQIDAKLHRVNTITDEKLARLEQLDAKLTAVVKPLGQALADGRMIHGDLAQATEKAQGLANHVTEQLERFDAHLAAYQSAGRDTFEKQLETMREAMLGEMSAELGQQRMRLDTQLAEAHAVAEREIVEKFDQLAHSLHEKADGILARTESAADAAMQRIRQQVVEAMSHAHETQEAFKAQLDDQQGRHREFLDNLTDAADNEMQVRAQRLDESMTGLAELFESQADQILTELRDRATTLLDQMSAAASKLQDDPSVDDADRRAA